MALVAHMLLTSCCGSELLVAVKAELAELDPLRDVRQKALQIGKAFDVEDVEVVFVPHIVEVLLHSFRLMIGEKADAERLKRSPLVRCLLRKIRVLWDG